MRLLTEKLMERKRKYHLPELPYLPKGKFVLIGRLPMETTTAGGLVIPHVWTEKMQGNYGQTTEIGSAREPEPMGVLMAAGLGALDELEDALIEIGDIVWFARFAGWEREVERDPEGSGRQILQCDVKEVIGSVDALTRVYGKDATHILVFDDVGEDATEKHWFVKKESTDVAA